MTEASNVYVPRTEEEDAIRRQLDEVRGDGTSRAVLLLGPGGAGKTTLVRNIAERLNPGEGVIWVRPIDVDDPQFWLLSNLETAVADTLDPSRQYFSPYFAELARIVQVSNDRASYETVLSQLGRINRTFVACYRRFVEESGTTAVITLDTIEAVRSMFLLLTLTQWMKELPRTLFILSGRPPVERRRGRPSDPLSTRNDPLRAELDDPHRPLKAVDLRLQGFADVEARQFLEHGPLHEALTETERTRLIELTDGQPLWLALAVEYFMDSPVPSEMTVGDPADKEVRESFRRRLVTGYRSTAFWPEAIKRLAVVRHSVTKPVWTELMSDRELPEGTDENAAWALLLERPWVRPRANARYVTLHDALAEELSQGVIPLHDRDTKWRFRLWNRAEAIYARLTSDESAKVEAERASIGAALESQDAGTVLDRITAANAEKRELDQLLTARLHYAILADFARGTDLFLELFDQATKRPDPLFLELLCHEMASFLPGRIDIHEMPEEMLHIAKGQFRRWLQDEPERYAWIAVRIAGFLIGNEQPEPALELLQNIPDSLAFEPELRYRIANERGNASMRIPTQVGNAQQHFEDALQQTEHFTGADEQVFRKAEAYKELGFFFRSVGKWGSADEAYRTARDALAKVMGPGSSDALRREMASIQTNWAYLKALRGLYRHARNLVDSAIAVRMKYGDKHAIGVSLSVSGEVYRYEGKFGRAMATYREAERCFEDSKSWPWLGVLYQEMAICLHQAAREGVELVPELQDDALSLIEQSLDICRESNARSYPSALNRAGRIFSAAERVDEGLDLLQEGIKEAERIGDGWFVSANTIEYVEYAYRAWASTWEPRYRELIENRVDDIAEVISRYEFKDLRARWDLLQGHMSTIDALAVHTAMPEGSSPDEATFREAAELYATGFHALADESVGSHGAAALAREFSRFRVLYDQLPLEIQNSWYRQLSDKWNAPDSSEQSPSLLARLEELY